MNPPKFMLITIIEIWLRSASSSVPVNSHKDETGEKRPSTTSADRYDRVDRYLTAKAWRLADPLRAAKQMGEKSKETKVTAAKSQRYHQERCGRYSWILIIKGGIFSTIWRFIYPTNLRNELNTRYTRTSNYNRLTAPV